MSDGWIRTFSGGKFWPLDPKIEDVRIQDIAHSLATKCRYGGQCNGFYSVAQHSVLVSEHCPGHELAALLHDSDEAYSPFGDIPRPVKKAIEVSNPAFGAYIKMIGDDIRDVVYAKYGLPPGEPEAVKAADNAILWDERAAFMNGSLTLMPEDMGGIGIYIEPWSWSHAEAVFLDRFYKLRGRMS